MRGTKRQVEELKKDNEKLQSQVHFPFSINFLFPFQVSEVISREKTINDENAKLRQGISDSIAKLAQYKHDLDDQKSMSNDLAEKIGEYEEKIVRFWAI